MKKLFLIVLILVGLCSNANASIEYHPQAVKLATQVAALKDKYHLEYKDEKDLLDTCNKIVKYCNYEKVFNKYDIASIVIKESKFNPKAFNKLEHVAGLMQITKPHKYWKDELFWFRHPYDKDENIKAGLVVLKTFYNEHKTKRRAIKHYNGSTAKSERYADAVLSIKRDLKSVKI